MPTVPGTKPTRDLMAGLLREDEEPMAGGAPMAPEAAFPGAPDAPVPGLPGATPEPPRPAPPADFLAGLERQGESLERSLRVSGEQSPDQIARVLKASRASGLAPEVIAGNPKLEALADAPPSMDWGQLAQRAPAVSRRLSDDPAVLGVARDDLLGLMAIEEEFKKFRRTPKLAAEKPSGLFQKALDLVTGYDPARAMAFGPVELEARRQGKTTEQLIQEALGQPDTYLQTNRRQQDVGRGIVGTLGTMAGGIEWMTGSTTFRDLSAQMRAAAVQGTSLDPEGATFASQLATGLGSMVAFWLPGLGVGVGAGALAKVAPLTARWLGVGVMSAAEALSEAGSVYQDAKARGMDEEAANRAAAWTFALNVPMLAITNKLGVFGSRGGLGRRAVMGGTMEGAQEVLQDLISGGAVGEGVTAKQLMIDFAIGGILGGPAAVATGKAMGLAKTAGPISEESLLLESIERKLAASPAAKRDARTVNSIIADVAREYGAPEQVYVPAEAMTTLFQAQPELAPAQVLSDLGISEEEFLQAVDLGTPLAIPMDHLASAVTSPAWQAIRGQISFEPMAFVAQPETPQEAPAGEPGAEVAPAPEGQREPPQAAQAAPERPTEAAPKVPVEARRAIERVIVAAGVSAPEARANAALIVRAAENFARRAGIDPMAYLERRGFAFQREAAPEAPAGAETLSQAAQAAGAQPVQEALVTPTTTPGEQDLYQGERGAVSFLKDGQAIIRLFQSADPSTIPHEVSHIFRRDLQELAEMEGADDQLQADWRAAQEWVGAQPGQDWTTAQEEQWAKGFEAYLLEGKAPAPSLRSLFNRFRKWLSDVYRSVRDIGVQISPEMREVYDRLLASDEEIAAARAQEVVKPMFTTKPEWMNEAVWASYQRLTAEAQASVAEKVLKRRLSDWRKAKRGWEAEALAEYLEAPANEPMLWAREQGGLNSGDLAQEMDPAAVTELERRGIASPQGKIALAELTQKLQATVETANLLAWGPEEWAAAAQQVDAAQYLATTPTENEYVAAQVAQKQAEFDAGMETWEAGLTDEVLAMMKAEAEALTRGLTVRPSDATTKRRIKEAVESETLGKLDSRLVTEKEALKFAMGQAARAARKAFSEGKRQGAGDEKWRQWDIAARLKARQDAWAEVRAIRADFKKVLRADPRKRSGMAWDFDIQVRHLLATYGIGRDPARLPAREKSLTAFVNELREEREDFSPPAWILSERPSPLAQLSLAELRQLHETVMGLVYIGKSQNEMLAHMAGTTFQDARDRLVTSIAETGRQRFIAPGDKPPEFSKSAIGKVGDRAHAAVANNTKIESIVQQLDGGEKMGTAWEILFRGPVLAENDQLRLEKEFGDEVIRLKKMLPKEFANNLHKRQTFAFLDQKNKTVSNEQILAMALNMGNQGNLDALMTGWLGVDRAALAKQVKEGEISQSEFDAMMADGTSKLNQMVGTLPPEAWTFVQGVWDMLERMAPRLDVVHRVMLGVPMSRVEAVPFTAPTGQAMRGGYYPLKWDPDASAQAEAFLIDQAQQNLFEHPYKSNRPEQGFRMERVGGKMAPLLSLSVLQKHLSDTIRYMTHAPMLRDVNKLVSDPSVAAAITRVVGQAKYKQFKPWLQGMARPDIVPTTDLEKAVATLMRNYAVAALSYSFKTVMMQPLALFNGAAEIGMPAATGGLLRYLASPLRLGGWITDVSPYMANRQAAMDRDLRQALQSKGPVQTTWDTFNRQWGFYMIGMADSITARGVWLGAYDQAVRKGLTQEVAIERADQVVRQTQGSALPKDLPAVQRGSVFNRAFTMFYTPFSATFNQIQAAHLSRDPIQIVRAWSWAIVVPAILSSIADWGWDELKGKKKNNLSAWRVTAGIPDYALGLLPFARLARGLVPEAINIVAGGRVVEPGFEARGLPVVTDPINKSIMALRHLGKGDVDKASLDAMQILGPVVGLPTNAIVSYTKIIQHAGD